MVAYSTYWRFRTTILELRDAPNASAQKANANPNIVIVSLREKTVVKTASAWTAKTIFLPLPILRLYLKKAASALNLGAWKTIASASRKGKFAAISVAAATAKITPTIELIFLYYYCEKDRRIS